MHGLLVFLLESFVTPLVEPRYGSPDRNKRRTDGSNTERKKGGMGAKTKLICGNWSGMTSRWIAWVTDRWRAF